jgi:hypothetical protein
LKRFSSVMTALANPSVRSPNSCNCRTASWPDQVLVAMDVGHLDRLLAAGGCLFVLHLGPEPRIARVGISNIWNDMCWYWIAPAMAPPGLRAMNQAGVRLLSAEAVCA